MINLLYKSLPALFLISCSSFPFVEYGSEVYKNFILSEDLEITKEFYEETPYAFIRAKIGRSNSAIMILVNEEDGVLNWISEDGVRISTYDGKVISITVFDQGYRLVTYKKPNNTKTHIVDLFGPDLYNLGISVSREYLTIDESIELNQKIKIVGLVEETFNAEYIGWRGKNFYYHDTDGNIRKTIQEIHPNLRPITIEFVKLYRQ